MWVFLFWFYLGNFPQRRKEVYLAEIELKTGSLSCSPACHWGFSDLFTVWPDTSEKINYETVCPFAYLRQDILGAESVE